MFICLNRTALLFFGPLLESLVSCVTLSHCFGLCRQKNVQDRFVGGQTQNMLPWTLFVGKSPETCCSVKIKDSCHGPKHVVLTKLAKGFQSWSQARPNIFLVCWPCSIVFDRGLNLFFVAVLFFRRKPCRGYFVRWPNSQNIAMDSIVCKNPKHVLHWQKTNLSRI